MRYVLPGIVCVALVGCGSGVSPTADVTGEVTLDGKPLETGVIIFETTGARPSTGKIENGKIVEVTTYKTGDGASVGQSKVSITAFKPPESVEVSHPGDEMPTDANYMVGTLLLPERYSNPESSGLTAEIKEGENNVVKFDLVSN